MERGHFVSRKNPLFVDGKRYRYSFVFSDIVENSGKQQLNDVRQQSRQPAKQRPSNSMIIRKNLNHFFALQKQFLIRNVSRKSK